MKPPINSEKHLVQQSNTTAAMGGVFSIPVIEAVQSPTLAKDVRVGAVIKAVYIEIWLNATDANSTTQQIFTIEKISSGASNPSFGDMTTLNAYANKKNILFTSQGNLGENGNQSVPIHRNWVAIPKGKQRFGQGDTLWVNIAAVDGDVDTCGLFIYKEYF